ncbi:hypothetical protein Hanom_Chr11g01049061 [Helianthus anomalus]
MTMFFFIIVSYFYYVMNLTRPEPSNRPVFFYVRAFDFGTLKKGNPLAKIPRSATACVINSHTTTLHN